MTSLKGLSAKQLDELVSRATRLRDVARGRDVAGLAQRVKALAKAAGVSVPELVEALGSSARSRMIASKRVTRQKRAKAKSKAPIRYRHPNDKSLTWSGRGVHARWVRDWLAENKKRKLDDLRVA